MSRNILKEKLKMSVVCHLLKAITIEKSNLKEKKLQMTNNTDPNGQKYFFCV